MSSTVGVVFGQTSWCAKIANNALRLVLIAPWFFAHAYGLGGLLMPSESNQGLSALSETLQCSQQPMRQNRQRCAETRAHCAVFFAHAYGLGGCRCLPRATRVCRRFLRRSSALGSRCGKITNEALCPCLFAGATDASQEALGSLLLLCE